MFMITDYAMVYPQFLNKKFFPQQLGMILQMIVSYPMYILIVHSFCSKSLRFVRHMTILLGFRVLFGFFNEVGPEMGINFNTRSMTKTLAQTQIIMCNIQLVSQIFKNRIFIFIYMVGNLLSMYIMTIAFNHKPGGNFMDFVQYAVTFATPMVSFVIFIYINHQNILANILSNI